MNSLCDRIFKEYHEAFRVLGMQPNAIYLGRKEYDEARSLSYREPLYLITQQTGAILGKDEPIQVRESIMGLKVYKSAEINHLNIIYSPNDEIKP